jgi:hypothetical protein
MTNLLAINICYAADLGKTIQFYIWLDLPSVNRDDVEHLNSWKIAHVLPYNALISGAFFASA